MSTPLAPEEELQKAEQAGRYMVAIWRVEEGKLQLYRMTENFPVVDFENAINLLRENIERDQNA